MTNSNGQFMYDPLSNKQSVCDGCSRNEIDNSCSI